MHWGKHKAKVQSAVKGHVAKVREKQKVKVQAYHEKHKANNTYKKLYDKHKAKGKAHLEAAKNAMVQHLKVQRARVKLGVHVAVAASPLLVKGAKAAHKVATNPDNIRKAKNVAQAMKRSPIRYVDGKKMANVVKTVYNNHGL
jgi:hypothetical protein